MTNDGNAILREIDVSHPAAKALIEISRAQDEEVGDGTTSVIILAGEIMMAGKPFIERKIHPTIIVKSFYKALTEGVKIIKEVAKPLDLKDEKAVSQAMWACIGTKFSSRWGSLIVDMAIQSVRVVMTGDQNMGKLTADMKRFAKVEKIPGGEIGECRVLNGVMLNKDIIHANMRRHIKNPRVLLLDCPLEYKKGESQTNIEMTDKNTKDMLLQEEVNEIASMCNHIIKWKPDLVVTEKGVSGTKIPLSNLINPYLIHIDLAQHYLMKANISILRRARKTDNNRIARVTGAKIIYRPDEIQESDIGTECGLFEVKKIGDEYFSFFLECKAPRACSVLLRGASKDVLNEMERNFHDAIGVARNLFTEPKLLPGGGAIEMEVSHQLLQKAKEVEGLEQLPYKARKAGTMSYLLILLVAYALEAIPRTLAQNCGADVIRVLTALRAKHSEGNGLNFGINGLDGKIADMSEIGIWEPLAVKL